jgi:RIO kinase 1
MPKLNPNLFLDEEYQYYADRQLHRRVKYKPNYKPKRTETEVVDEIAEQDEALESLQFTYNASRHEREWINNSLGNFYDQQWLDDVLRLLKGGKEASVYQCLGNERIDQEYIAAKIYRPRMFRNLRNDHLYREGRPELDEDGLNVINEGMLKAMRKRTAYGKRLLHTSWIEHEFKALQVLYAAGVDVPKPLASGYNSILMEYIGGPDMPAPTMNSVRLDHDEAQRLFQRLLNNIDTMLSLDYVHGDLSAYNILYWEGQITLIDFPQAVSPYENRNAYQIFSRDVKRVCTYFAAQGVKSKPRKLAADLWTAHNHRLGPDVNPAFLDDEDEEDRRFWQRYGMSDR